MLGKHASGPYEGKWGFSSLSAELDRRPQECAAKLAEVCTLGMRGRASGLVKDCKKIGKTLKGMQIYVLEEQNTLASAINNCSEYMTRCFPKGAIPPGILAWSRCKFININEIKKTLDPYTQDALQFMQFFKSEL